MRRSRGWERSGRLVVGLALALLVGYPLVRLVLAAFADGPEPVLATFERSGIARAVGNTVWTSAAVTAAAVALGTAGALTIERGAVPARRWLRAGLLLPLLVPPFVAALGWTAGYGPGGVLDDAVGVAVPQLYGPVGVITVITVNAVPLAYLIVAGALRGRAEPDLERAARVSGASVRTALWTITLPLLRPALGASAVVVFVFSVNSFGVPAVLGTPAGFETMTTVIYQNLAFAADPDAFTRVLVLAVALVLVAVGAVAVSDAVAAGGRVRRTGGPAGTTSAHVTTQGRWAAAVAWGYVGATSLVPLVALVLLALTRAVGLPPAPRYWTLQNFADAVDGRTLSSLGHSLLLAAVAATLLVCLGGLVAALERSPAARRLGTLATMTFALPGSALAVAALLAYCSVLADTLAIILVAYLGKLWALGHRPLAAAVDRLPGDVHRAARASGAGPATTLITVVAPLLSPALAAGWVLVFLFAFHELTMSALLYGPGTATLGVAVLNLQQLGDTPATAALAILLTAGVLVGAAPLLVFRGTWSRLRRVD
ncbi:MAG: ABC transporter permease [Egibacteraceae bacterium]